MLYMNEYDIEEALRRSDEGTNARKAAEVLARLAIWTNGHSDGWAYWPKPCRAAAKLQQALSDRFLSRWDRRVTDDLTDAELAAALRPVKAFITRQINGGGSDESDRLYILEGVR